MGLGGAARPKAAGAAGRSRRQVGLRATRPTSAEQENHDGRLLMRIKAACRARDFNETREVRLFHAQVTEARMQALKEFLTTDVGLLSAAVLAFLVAMGVFFVRFFVTHARRGD
jgi:hypothetical protein